MRTPIDQMIDLARVFSSDIRLTKDVNLRYMVSIYRVSYKENTADIMARSITGRGISVESACEDFMDKARGRLLFGDDPTYYGDKRPEFICV